MTTSSTLAGLAFVGTVLMAGCGSDGTAPDDSVTPSATALLSVTPQGGTTDIAPDGPFSFTFDGPMMSGTEGYVDLHRGDVTGPVHPMSCDWSADRARLTCTPGTPLAPGTWYTLHLGGGVRGSSGTPIHMDPGICDGAWVEPGPHEGNGPGADHMRGETHGGEPWPMMDPGWRHSNGTYGVVIPFRTA